MKILVTGDRTERPHGASLQLNTGVRYIMYRIEGRLRKMCVSMSGVNGGIPSLI